MLLTPLLLMLVGKAVVVLQGSHRCSASAQLSRWSFQMRSAGVCPSTGAGSSGTDTAAYIHASLPQLRRHVYNSAAAAAAPPAPRHDGADNYGYYD